MRISRVMSRLAVQLLIAAGMVLLLPSCSSLSLQQVDYAWPVESEIKVNQQNIVEEGRYAISFRVAQLATEEFGDSVALRGKKLRMLRSVEGYYFVTAPKFKHVYVFSPGPSELVLKSKIEVSQIGLTAPALNQRPPYVELLDGKNPKVYLTSDNIEEEKKQ
jgi:hypothetical protein